MENGLSGLNAIIVVFRMQSSTNPIQTILSFQTSLMTLFRIQYSSADRHLLFTDSAGSAQTGPNTIFPGKNKYSN